MTETNYYWQDGRRIEIEQADIHTTVHADSVDEATVAAANANVAIRSPQLVGPGLVKLELPADRDDAMQRLRKSHVVHHVYRPKGQPDQDILITSSFFLRFRKGTSRTDIDAYIRGNHLEIADVYDDRSFLVNVTDDTGINPIRASNRAAANKIVESAEPNLVRNLTRFQLTPADPLFQNQWHLSSLNDGTELVAGAGINAPGAWTVTQGVRDVVICVADDGIDITHPDFTGTDKIAGRLNVIPQANGTALTFDEAVMPQAGDYHGTPCAGVAVAEHNNTGTVGAAPGCALYAVRFPLSLTDAQMVRMFERISDNADVVSCSWGVGPADEPMSTQLRNTISSLSESGGRRGKGLIFCVAAGNNNCPVKDLNNTSTYQYINQFGLRGYSGPIDRWIAAHPDVITVSASTSLKHRAAYSSWGEDINVCAPSNNFDDLRRFRPRGRGIWTTDNENAGPNSDFTAGSRFTGDFGGTSSATPTVAGVCGLVISANRALTGSAVREIIESTATSDLAIESETNVNVPGDFDGNGFSQWFGHGKVDAARAVERAAGLAREQTVIMEAARDVPLVIPDISQPVTSVVEFMEPGVIEDLRVGIEITHSYIGDLVIDLIAPDGSAARLLNHHGGSDKNLNKVFNPDETPGLHAMISKEITGTWTLRIVDEWSFDRGRLDSWALAARVTLP